jgi:hypothetical protein
MNILYPSQQPCELGDRDILNIKKIRLAPQPNMDFYPKQKMNKKPQITPLHPP